MYYNGIEIQSISTELQNIQQMWGKCGENYLSLQYNRLKQQAYESYFYH